MQVSVAQLKKLRGRSLREIRARGWQELAKFNERWFGFGTAEMSDTALRREINSVNLRGGGEGLSALILERIRGSLSPGLYEREIPVFLPSLTCREEIPAIVLHRFPQQWRALITRANRAIAGRFDLLGFRDLSFGEAIDWHLEPTSGKRTGLAHWSQIDYLNPAIAGDKKVTWELNRHAHFVTFGQAYWLTNDERFAQAFVAQASSWMDANPPNRGINWASSLELALRSISWLWALHLLADSRHLTAKFVTRLLKFLVAHGRHIESYLSHYFSPNTHLTGEALGLLYLGTALPELSRARLWRQLGLNILLEQLPTQVREDGVYFEQSSYYHRYTVDFYLHLLVLARSCYWSLEAALEERLSRALDYLMWMTRPDGTTPLVGDDDGGRLLTLGSRAPDDFRDTLAIGATLFGRGDWKFVAGDAAVEMLWLLGPEGLDRYNEIEVRLPAENSRAFATSGYFVARDGWWRDASYLLVDGGAHGVYNCGHAHADALAFEFAAAGTTWLVDAGAFTYTADAAARNAFRETAAHNTATVDGESQSATAGTFSWQQIATTTTLDFISDERSERPASFVYFEGEHDGYRRLADPVTHRRALLFIKPTPPTSNEVLPVYLLVRDCFDAEQAHDYAIHYHFPAHFSAIASDNQIRVSDRHANKLAIWAFSQPAGGDASERATLKNLSGKNLSGKNLSGKNLSENNHLESRASRHNPARHQATSGNAARARIRESWVSRAYGRREAAAAGVIESRGKGRHEVMSFILPFTAKHQGVQVERRDTGIANTGAFTVTLGDSRDVVIAGNGLQTVECERLRAVASMAWARFVEGRLVRASLVKGKELEVAGRLRLRSSRLIRNCVIQVNDDHLDITIEGTEQFDLKTTTAAGLPQGQKIVLGGRRFQLDPKQSRVSFAHSNGRWQLADSRE